MCNSFFLYSGSSMGSRTPLLVIHIQYSPKIMHAQEVAQEVVVPQEHTSGQKKLNCSLSTRTFKAQEDRKLAARSRKKLRTYYRPQDAKSARS